MALHRNPSRLSMGETTKLGITNSTTLTAELHVQRGEAALAGSRSLQPLQCPPQTGNCSRCLQFFLPTSTQLHGQVPPQVGY